MEDTELTDAKILWHAGDCGVCMKGEPGAPDRDDWTFDRAGVLEFARAVARQAVLAERAARDQAAFRAGWMTAANWMERDDLLADIGSPAYLKDMADALVALSDIRKGE